LTAAKTRATSSGLAIRPGPGQGAGGEVAASVCATITPPLRQRTVLATRPAGKTRTCVRPGAVTNDLPLILRGEIDPEPLGSRHERALDLTRDIAELELGARVFVDLADGARR
jgi:hypothetical protein